MRLVQKLKLVASRYVSGFLFFWRRRFVGLLKRLESITVFQWGALARRERFLAYLEESEGPMAGGSLRVGCSKTRVSTPPPPIRLWLFPGAAVTK